LPQPSRFCPWQAAHSRAYSLAPARCARSLASIGLLTLAVAAGARRMGLPHHASAPLNAIEAASALITRLRGNERDSVRRVRTAQPNRKSQIEAKSQRWFQ